VYFRKYPLRFSVIFITLIGSLSFFSVKLLLIQIFRSDHLAKLASRQHNYFVEIEPVRGGIYDRRMRPLAFNVTVYSLFANPRSMGEEDKRRAIHELPELLGMDPAEIEGRLSRNKFFVWIGRKLDKTLADRIAGLKIRGLGFRKESKRYYPNGSLAAHVIGFAGVDNQGLEGLELRYNNILKGESGQTWILRDARQRELMIEEDFFPPRDGFKLILTVDETIQYIAETALNRAVAQHKAAGGSVVVMDVRTGEILALANYPTYSLENLKASSVESRTNRAISFVYEPGSVFKVITAAAALEEKAFKEEDKIFCENGNYRIANHTLTDHTPHGTLSFREVIKVSSNIGTVKVAQKLGPEVIYRYGRRFRFGEKTNIDLLGEVGGWLKRPAQWSKTTIGAIPIGYEITVTPLQLVCAITAVANGGLYMKPLVVKAIKDQHDQLIKEFEPEIVDRVISGETARRLRDILVEAVETGTGKRARIPGVSVAGKTGTARKVVNGAYAPGKYYASFIGFAPADNPRLAAVVVIDEPRPSYFGGTVSAPVFKEMIENSLKYLEVQD
jgi:cell division protein FtsI (penicillin-binding protein 3)